MTEIKVSVVMITYNHEPFIKQAVESIITQQTDFEFELLIGNDRSPDNTDEIIRNIIDSHPKGYRIKYFLHEKNLGITPNSKVILDKVTGKYFATCEGDDYWTDPEKLQKQVEFLDSNSDFAICFHNTRIEYFDDDLPAYLLNENIEKDIFSLDDLIGEDEIWFMATTSLMVRSQAFFPIPDWYVKSKSGDIPLIILAARNGLIKYLPDVMAVYRKTARGISNTDQKEGIKFMKNRVFMYSMIDKSTNFKYHALLRRNIARYYYMMIFSEELSSKYLTRLSKVFTYFRLTFPKIPDIQGVIRYKVIPPVVFEIYSAIKKSLGLWKEAK